MANQVQTHQHARRDSSSVSVVCFITFIVLIIAMAMKSNRNVEMSKTEAILIREEQAECERRLINSEDKLKAKERAHEKCLMEKDYALEEKIVLEEKLEGALRGKMLALEEKLQVLQIQREGEVQLLDVLSELQTKTTDLMKKQELLTAKSLQLEEIKYENKILWQKNLDLEERNKVKDARENVSD